MFAPGFAPYNFSENIVNSKLAIAFQNNGWEIHTISRVDEGPLYSTAWQDPWTPLKESTFTIKYPFGNRWIRLLDLLYQGIKVQFTLEGVRWAGRALDLAMELHKRKNFDVVLSRSPNDIGHVPALFFSKKTNIPWIANLNDPPVHFWPAPYKSEERVLRRTFSRILLSRVIMHANFVTFPSTRLRSHTLGPIKKVDDAKAKTIPHIGLSGYKSKSRKPDGCFRICHAGNLSHERQPKSFFEGISRFVERIPMSHPFEVLIVGASSHELITLAETYGIAEHIKISGGLNYLDTLNILEQSDVLAIVEAPCKEGIFLPSKVTDYAQVGRPILAVSPINGVLADLIRQTNAGEFADCEDPASVARAITSLYRAWRNGDMKRAYPSAALWEHFRPENIVSQYEDMFFELGL